MVSQYQYLCWAGDSQRGECCHCLSFSDWSTMTKCWPLIGWQLVLSPWYLVTILSLVTIPRRQHHIYCHNTSTDQLHPLYPDNMSLERRGEDLTQSGEGLCMCISPDVTGLFVSPSSPRHPRCKRLSSHQKGFMLINQTRFIQLSPFLWCKCWEKMNIFRSRKESLCV